MPRLGAAATAAVTAFTAGAEQAKDVAAPRLDLARETAHVGSDRARGAYHVLRGDAVAKPRSGKGKWLIVIGLGAALLAGAAAFRKQRQADDPWATPLDNGSGTWSSAGDSTATTGASLKDKAGSALDDAKDKLGDAADKAKDKAGDLAAKGQSALADAKDRSGELVDDANDKVDDLAADAKQKAEEAKAKAQSDPSDDVTEGETTDAPGDTGADAVTGDAAPRRVGGEFGDEKPN
ncbi:ElaB/YqjD/DUF883 family membrane-anchored ribosome-binding protein [Terracoccus luteus]|uniref:ElaB/YqjD/DUF883 family membrane-anchored ribosome-binding protein n=1 Tax=Terracoccus luteus TaxID=53356 RepID=A0A839Q2G0_9MICO|nr:ElaB/YqjD/DUF883 family membrane-anchored ribosome-binding protein [Terracoccus luteus]MCP2172933.1 ElaB/YqjD/DUF883 family membrane-anchored ribosome-binding protein [Terracoccus luteus]